MFLLSGFAHNRSNQHQMPPGANRIIAQQQGPQVLGMAILARTSARDVRGRVGGQEKTSSRLVRLSVPYLKKNPSGVGMGSNFWCSSLTGGSEAKTSLFPRNVSASPKALPYRHLLEVGSDGLLR